jgi:hypothetical protein
LFCLSPSISTPSTGFEDSGHLPASDIYNIIFGSPALPLLDAVFKHLKPTLCEAPPHIRLQASKTPLQPFPGDLISDGDFGCVPQEP